MTKKKALKYEPRPTHPSLEEAEAIIGEPAADWEARCMEIAMKLAEGLGGAEKGYEPVYGHFRGKVAEGSRFYKASAMGFVQHGWIETEDGIIDPTRWAFEAVEPYIHFEEWGVSDVHMKVCLCGHLGDEHDLNSFAGHCKECTGEMDEETGEIDPADVEAGNYCGGFAPDPYDPMNKDNDEYDRGGNQLRAQFEMPAPDFDPEGDVIEIDLGGTTRLVVNQLLGMDMTHQGGYNFPQLMWLANLSLDRLGPAAKPVFQGIIDAGHPGLLPIDNRKLVLGEAY